MFLPLALCIYELLPRNTSGFRQYSASLFEPLRARAKTRPTDASVEEFLESVENPTRKSDGFKLLEIMKEVIQEKPVMWGTSIIGFGTFHYKYASGHARGKPS
ncbi:MAG: hypothetical protein ACFFCW_49375 [Candidatus Hodarchaeota archaeon]